MPQIIRSALAARLREIPELKRFLDDFREATGLPLRFLPLTENPTLPEEPEAGVRLCHAFRLRMREEASAGPVMQACEAGLWEIFAPVIASGVCLGHLVVSGCGDGNNSVAQHNRVRHLLAKAGVRWAAPLVAELREQAPVVPARRREAISRLLVSASEHLASLVTTSLIRPPDVLPHSIAKACQLVKTEFARPLPIREVARHIGMSTGHLSRLFHQSTGLRFVEYLARFRAERARELLLSSQQPVQAVARQCGFASVSQFNRVFRAVHQVSPRALRTRAKEVAGGGEPPVLPEQPA
jgi:AraC-like DNA-binding protein